MVKNNKKMVFELFVDEKGNLQTSIKWDLKKLSDEDKLKLVLTFAQGLAGLQQAQVVNKIRQDFFSFGTIAKEKEVSTTISVEMDKWLNVYMNKNIGEIMEGAVGHKEEDGEAPIFNSVQAFSYNGGPSE